MSLFENQLNSKLFSCLTIDVEDWFHILDSPAAPSIERWSSLESRIERNLEMLLEVLDSLSVKATFFWLGWLAERHKDLVRKCQKAGHEIASHGYSHVLVYEVGEKLFRQDIIRSKAILEDIIGEAVIGFRSAGFGITQETPWALNAIMESGFLYDSSIFPASHGHGGILNSPFKPFFVETQSGYLLEVPLSAIDIFGWRTSFFGGGHLRAANKLMIKWGIDKLQASGRPLVVYIHPREIDPDHPRLPLNLLRRFKCYVNLKSTLPKLKWLCEHYSFYTMLGMIENYIRSFYLERKTIPIVHLQSSHAASEPSPTLSEQTSVASSEASRSRHLAVDKAVANFLSPGILRSHRSSQYKAQG
ncbi:MAG: hypothetical protein CEE38_04955 [Planctomycetes bacterium B3_Pla]|nr:MAG: hypothetical protein CEE38_04955 [Planctomycetes bacterium B3_Pla]